MKIQRVHNTVAGRSIESLITGVSPSSASCSVMRANPRAGEGVLVADTRKHALAQRLVRHQRGVSAPRAHFRLDEVQHHILDPAPGRTATPVHVAQQG